MKSIISVVTGTAFVLTALVANAGGVVKQTVDAVGQGAAGALVAQQGATILRTANGITARLSVPTPAGGTYVYPPDNMFQQEVIAGAPEVFTGWILIFNDPGACEGPCDGEDLSNSAARGGAYNFAGHAVGGSMLNLAGHVSVGSETFVGYPLDDPENAEVHLAVAPHGQLQPDLLPTQITTPIGIPTHWWLAIFMP